MLTKNRIILVLALIAVVLGVRYQIILNKQVGTPEEQIAAVIQRGESAVERNDTRTAMSCVSKNYKDDTGMTYPILRIRVADELNSPVRLDVTLTNSVIQATGDKGRIQFHARVVDRRDNDVIFDNDLTLLLRKEKLRKHLIFHYKDWRITSAQGLEAVTGF